MERIYSAATEVLFYDTNLKSHVVILPLISGLDVIDILKPFNLVAEKDYFITGRGFLTNEKRYVDRVEAMEIARASGQLLFDTDNLKLYENDIDLTSNSHRVKVFFPSIKAYIYFNVISIEDADEILKKLLFKREEYIINVEDSSCS